MKIGKYDISAAEMQQAHERIMELLNTEYDRSRALDVLRCMCNARITCRDNAVTLAGIIYGHKYRFWPNRVVTSCDGPCNQFLTFGYNPKKGAAVMLDPAAEMPDNYVAWYVYDHTGRMTRRDTHYHK